MYLFPARDWSDIYSLNLDTGAASSTSAIYEGRVPRLYADGQYLYVGGSWFSKWFIGDGIAKKVGSYSSSSVSSCGNLWLTEDARRMFTACAKAYRTSSLPTEDFQPNGSLSTLQYIAWADESVTQRKTVVLAGASGYDTPGATQLQVYGDAFLDFTGSQALPPFQVDGKSYSSYGQQVFWTGSNDRVVVLLKADSAAGLKSSYGLAVMSPSVAGQITLALPQKGGVNRSTTGSSAEITTGWARFSPNFGSGPSAGLAIFGQRRDGILISEATVPATSPLKSGRIYAEVSPTVNVGLALANPTALPADVSYYFTDENGTDSGQGSFTIPANGQIAAFLNGPPFPATTSFTGTLTFSSETALGAIALRGYINANSDFLWSTLPVVPLGGGAHTQGVFPSFVDGGNWTTEFLLVNDSDSIMNGILQFFSQGTPSTPGALLTLTVDRESGTSFPYSIPPRSSRKLTTSGASAGVVVGSARINSFAYSTPSGVAVFSSKNADGGRFLTTKGAAPGPALPGRPAVSP